MNASDLRHAFSLLAVLPMALTAQMAREYDPVPLKHWVAPLYWQPSQAVAERAAAASASTTNLPLGTNALVFVGMTPCRVVDTRSTQGFTGAFGPPSLAGGQSRSFPIQSSPNCAIPSVAQAYSFNVTVVPPGPLGFITVYPTGQSVPLAATLNSLQGFIVGNAAIAPAGTGNGAVSVYASDNTDLVLDINGYFAAPTDINNNTALGASALASNSSGKFNTAIGDLALSANTTGSDNIAVGDGALQANTSGLTNTALGTGTLSSNTTGGSNVAVGGRALALNTAGGLNTAVGAGALAAATGDGNIAIGSNAGRNLTSSSNNIMIGHDGVAGDNGITRIGQSQILKTFIAGITGVTTGVNNAVNVVIDSNGQLGTINSSRRFKEDIRDMGAASSGLQSLRPVTYRYKQPYSDGSKPLDYGLIAEEVAGVYPDLVAKGADGQVATVQYQKLTPMLLNELQKEHRELQQQAETIRLLQTHLAELELLLSSRLPPLAVVGQ